MLASLGDAACSVPPFARNPPQPAPDPRSEETQPTPTHSLRRPIPTRPNIAHVKTRPKKPVPTQPTSRPRFSLKGEVGKIGHENLGLTGLRGVPWQ